MVPWAVAAVKGTRFAAFRASYPARHQPQLKAALSLYPLILIRKLVYLHAAFQFPEQLQRATTLALDRFPQLQRSRSY